MTCWKDWIAAHGYVHAGYRNGKPLLVKARGWTLWSAR